MVVALVGFSWFANFKVYERDRDALREEIRSRVEAEMISVRASVTQRSSEARSALEKLIDERYSLVQTEIRSRHDDLRHEAQDLRFDLCELRGNLNRSQEADRERFIGPHFDAAYCACL